MAQFVKYFPQGFAATIGDEVRDNAVFENRMLTSGAGYVNNVNVAQAGTLTTVVIAAADTAVSAAYLGMRIFIITGVGVGQTAYFTYYSSGTKAGIIAKESFTTITASAVTATGALITVPSTVTFYVGMPITFTGTTIGGFALATVYYVATIDALTNKIGISATSGGVVIATGLSDVTASTMTADTVGTATQVDAATGQVADESLAKAAGVERIAPIQTAEVEIIDGALTERVVGVMSEDAKATAPPTPCESFCKTDGSIILPTLPADV